MFSAPFDQPADPSAQEVHPMYQNEVSEDHMDVVFKLCRQDEWEEVLKWLIYNPNVGVTPMIMDNHITTTVLHQAITSKGETALRANVIRFILDNTPHAATLKNGYGSLPLHVISQRNTKMDAQTKESFIFKLVDAYEEGLVQEGGVGKRTPLHIIFTDYISPRVTRMMINRGPSACFKRDKNGYLPAHVACSRHCSPEKLRMLLEVNPDALFSKTKAGKTLMDLAKKKATKAHPNHTLLKELAGQLKSRPLPRPFQSSTSGTKAERGTESESEISETPDFKQTRSPSLASQVTLAETMSCRDRCNSSDSMRTWHSEGLNRFGQNSNYPSTGIGLSLDHAFRRGGNPMEETYCDDPAGLLLHFHRHGSPGSSNRYSDNANKQSFHASQYAEV